MNQEYIKFQKSLKHSDEQLMKAMEMLATLMKMPVEDDIQEWKRANAI